MRRGGSATACWTRCCQLAAGGARREGGRAAAPRRLPAARGGQRRVARGDAFRARHRRRPQRLPAPLPPRRDARPRDARARRLAPDALVDDRPRPAPRALRPADRVEPGALPRATDRPRGDAGPTARCTRRRRPRPSARSLRPSSAALGLHARRGATLVRVCTSLDLDRLRDCPAETVARRLGRERGLGPWSVGVVALEGLGRYDLGLVGDLGLIKLVSSLRGRRAGSWETEELLAPYGEWAGLASVYLLSAWGRGLLPVSPAHGSRPRLRA